MRKGVNEDNKDNDKIKLIEDSDLQNYNQYDEKTLVFNIERRALTPYKVFQTQKNLSNEFIIEYILNEEDMEDHDITLNKLVGKFPNFAYFDPKTYKNKKGNASS